MKTGAALNLCPVCDIRAKTYASNKGVYRSRIKCLRCGCFEISDTALEILPAIISNDEEETVISAAIGYYIRSLQRFASWPLLLSEQIERIAKNPYFPTVSEQLELLLEYVGDQTNSIGVQIELNGDNCQFIYGGRHHSNIKALVQHLMNHGLLQGEGDFSYTSSEEYDVYLTVAGWDKYEEIKRGETIGRSAFMAMPFGKKDLDDEWLPALRKAVSETGFQLQRVDDAPEPGLIDTKMRLQIKAARFLIVELTHANNGAYWEAGLAEGLGKPVIYTCKKGEKAHFDVEHSFRVIWDPDDFSTALRTVKATIRNCFSDAKPRHEVGRNEN